MKARGHCGLKCRRVVVSTSKFGLGVNSSLAERLSVNEYPKRLVAPELFLHFLRTVRHSGDIGASYYWFMTGFIRC